MKYVFKVTPKRNFVPASQLRIAENGKKFFSKTFALKL